MTREIKKCSKCRYSPDEMKRIYARVYEDHLTKKDRWGTPLRKQIFKPIGWMHDQCGFVIINELKPNRIYKGKLRS